MASSAAAELAGYEADVKAGEVVDYWVAKEMNRLRLELNPEASLLHRKHASRITGDVKCSCGFFYCEDEEDEE
jgi:hypothetical protein